MASYGGGIYLRLAQDSDLSFIMATERLPTYDRFIGQWSESEHRQAMATQGTVYLIASTSNTGSEGFAIVRDTHDAEGNVFLKRVAVTSPGAGFGLKFMRALVDWIFENTQVHRLWLDAIDHNHRARHVYRKLGFSEEGLLRECYVRTDGTRANLVVMSLLRREWSEAKAR